MACRLLTNKDSEEFKTHIETAALREKRIKPPERQNTITIEEMRAKLPKFCFFFCNKEKQDTLKKKNKTKNHKIKNPKDTLGL